MIHWLLRSIFAHRATPRKPAQRLVGRNGGGTSIPKKGERDRGSETKKPLTGTLISWVGGPLVLMKKKYVTFYYLLIKAQRSDQQRRKKPSNGSY